MDSNCATASGNNENSETSSTLKATAKEFVPSKLSDSGQSRNQVNSTTENPGNQKYYNRDSRNFNGGYKNQQNRPNYRNGGNYRGSNYNYQDGAGYSKYQNSRNYYGGNRNQTFGNSRYSNSVENLENDRQNNNEIQKVEKKTTRNLNASENLENQNVAAGSSNLRNQNESQERKYTGAVRKRIPPNPPPSRNFSRKENPNESPSNNNNGLDRNYQSRNLKPQNSYRNQYNPRNNNSRSWRSTEEDRYYEDTHNNANSRNYDRQKYVNNQSSNYRNANNYNKRFANKIKETATANSTVLSQREKLTQEIQSNKMECMICCEYVKNTQSTWHCSNCFHILHLNCIIKWARSSKSDEGWRCVACQDFNKEIPRDYICFCGKVKNPQYNHTDLPHSCGEVCRKTENCNHPCSLLCHPGKCPTECQSFVIRSCGCGKTEKTFQCSQKVNLLCENVCEKLLNCGVHKCLQKCHEGECEKCIQQVEHSCHCGKEKRQFICNQDNNLRKSFACENACGRKLNCLNHKCGKICHEGDCNNCELSPDLVTHCPCGKFPIPKDQRKTCLDPIPTCKGTCNKPLKCGPLSSPHACQIRCHLGKCSSCNKNSSVKCRCGRIEEIIKCKNLTDGKDIRCKKKCTKFRSCGKHKCNQECCIDIEHVCNQNCNRILSCGRHKCDRKCHIGNCATCPRVSFDELPCECGAEIIFPPVPCGTKKPICTKPCKRTHSCEHSVLHNCHSDANCPPCVIFTTKYCFGKHEQRKTIPCNQASFSCGMACDKPLPCGHKCIRPCHEHECMKPNEICKQKCTVTRDDCEHACGAPCHKAGSCPDTQCREKVEVQCPCGNRKALRFCQEFMSEYKKIFTAALQDQMQESQQGGDGFDFKFLYGNASKKDTKTLECNEACKQVERNRRLDIAFKVQNPNLINYPKFVPNYSDFLRTFYKKDPGFVNNIHEKLTELVKLAKDSKQKFRSLSFPVMNRDKRHVVHEMCELFGIESQAFDEEPNRNVVATCYKETSWLPSMSLQEVIQKENGQQRNVPVPTNAWAVKK